MSRKSTTTSSPHGSRSRAKSGFISRVLDLDNPPPFTPEMERQMRAARKRGLRPEDLVAIPPAPPGSREVFMRFQTSRRQQQQSFNIHLDQDVFRWLRSLGADAQRRLNTVLRAAMRKDAQAADR